MLRKFWILATLLAVVSLGATAQADVFVTGVGNANTPPGSAGGFARPGINIFTGGGGFSFTNAFATGPNGTPQAGDKVTAVGFALMNTAGGGNFNFTNNVTAVYAIEGTFGASPNLPGSTLSAHFTTGQIRVYDTGVSAATPISLTNIDPTQWVANINSLNTGVLGIYSIHDDGEDLGNTGVIPGPGGANLNVPDNQINDAFANLAGVSTAGTFLLDFVSGSFIDFLGALNPGIAVNIDETFRSDTLASLNISQTDLDNMDKIFAALVGSGSFTGGPGGYNPTGNGANGDVVQTLNFEAHPGSFVPVTEIPEPASLIVWSVMAAGGAGLGMIRRRRNQA